MSGHAAAIFGFERVMLRQGPEPVFARWLGGTGLKGAGRAQLADWSSRLWPTGAAPDAVSARIGRAVLSPVAGWKTAAVARAAQSAADELDGRLLPYARVEIEDHRAAGRTLALVSGLPEPFVGPLAERWGFDTVLATRWEAADGVYTGRLDGPPPAGGRRFR